MTEKRIVSEQRKSSRGNGRDAGGRVAAINSLIAALASEEGLVRESARRRLVHIGRPAVRPLVKALSGGDTHTRWEAAKALGYLADPATAPALVRALQDDEFGVRWLAAEGLILLGGNALEPLLRALMEGSDSVWLRQGAHHVLRALSKRGFREVARPVLAALDGLEPWLQVPQAAEDARDALARARKRQRARRGQGRASPQRARKSGN
jgi:HEAT repeat protein